MIVRASSFLALCLVPGLAACVAERDAWIPLDLDESELVQSLGEFGHDQLCNAFEGYVHGQYRSVLLVEAACTAHALQTTKNATECAAAVDTCLQTLPAPVEDQLQRILEQADCNRASSGADGCGISDLITCLGDLGDAVTNVKLTVTCAAFGSPVPPNWWRIAPPESCLDLARCVL